MFVIVGGFNAGILTPFVKVNIHPLASLTKTLNVVPAIASYVFVLV